MMKYLYLFLLPFLVFFQSCKDFQGSTVRIPDQLLEVHGDSIRFTTDARIKKDAKIKKDSRYHLQPQLGDAELEKAEVFDETQARNVRKNGLDTTMEFTAPFSPEMQGKQLSLRHIYFENGEPETVNESKELAECCIISSHLIRDDYRYMHTITEKTDSVPLKIVTQVNFPLDVWELNETSFSETDIMAIKDFLRSGKDGSEVRIKGNASPDGPLERNEFLAKKRAEEVSDWLQEELRSAGRENYLEKISSYSLDKNSEDWKGFVRLLDESDLAPEVRKQIIKIVENQELTSTEKEERIANLAGGSIYELEKILSPLRKTTLVIEGYRNGKSDEELDSIATAYTELEEGIVPEHVFTREEWLDVAARVTGREGKKTLLMAFYEKYPDDYRIFNDLGIVTLTGDSVRTAFTEKSASKPSSFPEEGDFSFDYETEDEELEFGREDDEFRYEWEKADTEIKIKDGPDEFRYEKETPEMEIKAKADRDENQYKYEREFDGGEVKFKKEEGELEFSSRGMDVDRDFSGMVPDELKKDYQTAQALFTLADSVHLGSIQMECRVRCVFAGRKKLQAAKHYFEKSLKARETQEAHYNLGILHARMGNYEEALFHLNQADKIPGMEYNLGLVKMMKDDYKGARKDLTEYLRTNPRDAFGYYAMAILGARMDDPGCVYVNLDKAVKLNPELAEKAASDLEFKPFREDRTFARALEGEAQF